MSLDCVWSEGSLESDNRSHYAMCTLLNNALDKAEGLGFVHRNSFSQLPKDSTGAVVIIHGDHQLGQAQELAAQVRNLSWAVTVIVGNEPGNFPAQLFKGSRRKVWFGYCVPGVHDYVDRRLIFGYPHDCQLHLANCHDKLAAKPLDWSYCGQVNHASRRSCVGVLRNLKNGFLLESSGFWQGLPRDEYYRKVASSKVVPCPTGACTPDTIRLAEALEAGCVPVAEDRWPPGYPRVGIGSTCTGYWEYVLQERPPFPLLSNWQDFPVILERVLGNFFEYQRLLGHWWAGYKERMPRWLVEDVRAVGGI